MELARKRIVKPRTITISARMVDVNKMYATTISTSIRMEGANKTSAETSRFLEKMANASITDVTATIL